MQKWNLGVYKQKKNQKMQISTYQLYPFLFWIIMKSRRVPLKMTEENKKGIISSNSSYSKGLGLEKI